MRPTDDTYSELQQAYDYFNAGLFNNQLPTCLITLQREKKTYGYFSAQRFVRREDGVHTDEIAMNPAYFAVCPLLEVMQTLVHEMVHLWQHHFGKPGRRRYHNQEWANKMEFIGLMPSSTGKPGGKKIGDYVCDYPIQGGQFLCVYEKLLTTNFKLSWLDRFPARHVATEVLENVSGEEISANLGVLGINLNETIQSKSTREKYTCPTCETNVWGKPALKLICGECNSAYEQNIMTKETKTANHVIALQ